MKIRSSVLAVPAALLFTVAAAGAQSVSLTPLAPTHRATIAVTGATCANPYAAAQMSDASLEYPEVTRAQQVEGVAYVGITLLPNGTLAHVWPIASTGNGFLDAAAIDAVRNARYTAERAQCESVGGDYTVKVDFSLGE
jgi:TonB family protein